MRLSIDFLQYHGNRGPTEERSHQFFTGFVPGQGRLYRAQSNACHACTMLYRIDGLSHRQLTETSSPVLHTRFAFAETVKQR